MLRTVHSLEPVHWKTQQRKCRWQQCCRVSQSFYVTVCVNCRRLPGRYSVTTENALKQKRTSVSGPWALMVCLTTGEVYWPVDCHVGEVLWIIPNDLAHFQVHGTPIYVLLQPSSPTFSVRFALRPPAFVLQTILRPVLTITTMMSKVPDICPIGIPNFNPCCSMPGHVWDRGHFETIAPNDFHMTWILKGQKYLIDVVLINSGPKFQPVLLYDQSFLK